MALAPLLVIIWSWSSDQTEVWQHLIETQLSTLLRNTLVLVIGVGSGVTLLGVSLAWLTVMCEFPGRRWLDWALMLPMAMPAYVLAFVVLGIFDFAGPLQQGLHSWFGSDYRYIDIRHEAAVIAVLVLVFYPYVYMLARSAFLAQSTDIMEAARVLGANRWRAFFRVALPMARPAIIAGTSLAIMETLADFGTVAVFNYDTFTTAIYKSWFGLFNLQAAAQLASLLLLFVALALMAEKYSRGSRSYTQSDRKQHRFRHQLSPLQAFAASAFCGLVLLLAFVLPVLQLLQWVLLEGLQAMDARYLNLLWRTLLLGGAAAILTVALALLLAFGRRRAKTRLRTFYDLGTLGYALPGSVLAVGIMLSFTFVDNQFVAPLLELFGLQAKPLLLGSVFALLAAYWVRFLAVANGPVDSSLQRIRPSIPEAARSLGSHSWPLLWQIYLPILRPGLLTAMVLVFVDVMKEMPATLLLRPYGWDTLAVRIYEMTSEGEWERAALPALTLILVGLLPVIQAVRQSASR
ncbi:ABC transporter permease [Oceanicoccus sagamiensis]|uniref:ABC transporter permease n=2 Tax=Oceanicoccus sagamiensis TaxID=716816 RepID=A0A1X9NIW0_9GAMM|nr:ABC transporter permease [Oceanicoccus sagamiensis]